MIFQDLEVNEGELTLEAVFDNKDGIENDDNTIDSDFMNMIRNYENINIINGDDSLEMPENDEFVQCKENCLTNNSSTANDLCDGQEYKWEQR